MGFTKEFTKIHKNAQDITKEKPEYNSKENSQENPHQKSENINNRIHNGSQDNS